MGELDVTFRRVLNIWWLLMWRGILWGTLLTIAAGFLSAVALEYAGVNVRENTGLIGGTAGYIVGLVWGFWVVRMALRKKYKEFRLVLVPNTQ